MAGTSVNDEMYASRFLSYSSISHGSRNGDSASMSGLVGVYLLEPCALARVPHNFVAIVTMRAKMK